MVLFALSQATNNPWTSPVVAVWGLSGSACLVVFSVIELHASPPMLDLRLFRQGLFVIGTAIIGWANASYTGFIFLLTLFLQNLQGRSPLQAGLIQAPSDIGSALAFFFAARFYARIGPRRMMAVGFGMGGLMLVPFGFVDQSGAARAGHSVCLHSLADHRLRSAGQLETGTRILYLQYEPPGCLIVQGGAPGNGVGQPQP